MESAVRLSSSPLTAKPLLDSGRTALNLDLVTTDESSKPVPAGAAAPQTLLAEVHVFVNGAQLAKYAVEHGEYIIGRDATCHIVVDAEQVSRHHARLTFSAFELIIEDLGSSNGVFISGVKVQIPTRVRADQEVQI